jgi:two-component sensor histidine kinase
MTETLLDESVATLPYFSALSKSPSQSWTGLISESGQEHIVSARRLKSWPLIVSASLPRVEVYSAAWARLLWRSVVALMTITGLLLLTVLAVRQARREAVLMGELEHRVKNMLVVVTAVIERAREGSEVNESFVSSLRSRIKSMADAQELLSQSQWRGVSLADLVRAELEPYTTATNTQIDGPLVYLTTDATHGVAMVVHELTTNAAKYGALSRPGGRVSVRWTRTPEAMKLMIQWDEVGGPEVAMPDRQGYGSSVIRDLLAYELGGTVDLKFAPSGVHCTIELPARCIL